MVSADAPDTPGRIGRAHGLRPGDPFVAAQPLFTVGVFVSLFRILSGAAATAVVAGGALALAPTAAIAAPITLSSPASSCIPDDSGISNGDPNPIDTQANVYVGGDFTLLAGAELEGLLVVDGDAEFLGSGLYNAGVVGVGSLLTPPPMSDMIVVGGDMSVAEERTLDVGHKIGGAVRVGGTLSAAPNAITANTAPITSELGKAEALGGWAGIGDALVEQSARYAALPASGTASVEYGTLVLTGDGTANRQVFAFDLAKLPAFTSMRYADIPDGTVVVVNVSGDRAAFDVTAMLHANNTPIDALNTDRAEFASLTQRLLWNFTEATEVVIGSTAQFPGSMLVAHPDSTTTVRVPGTNGRMWVAGDLVHDLGTGSEIHAFPFLDSAVLGCGQDPATAALIDPEVVQAHCSEEGIPTPPRLVLPESTGISYTVSGAPVAGGTVTVTATSIAGALLTGAAGWTVSEDGLSATKHIVFDELSCESLGSPVTPPTPVTPVAPSVTPATCSADGTVTAPEVIPATTPGITYAVDGDLTSGGTVTVTASPEGRTVLVPAEGWSAAADGTAVFTVVLDDPDCASDPAGESPNPQTSGPEPSPAPAAEQPAASGDTAGAAHDAGLANTGAASLPALGIGALALLALGGLAFSGRAAQRAREHRA